MPVRGKILCRFSTAQMSAPAGIFPNGKFTFGPDKVVVLVGRKISCASRRPLLGEAK